MKYVLWTGGFDSTYRVATLVLAGETVQPVYILDPRRASTPYERKAMETLSGKLNSRAAGAVLAPILLAQAEDDGGETARAFLRLKERMYMGTQYIAIALCARDHPGLELCVHKDDKAMAMLREYGDLEALDAGAYRLGKGTDADMRALFGGLSFPIADKTKLDMKDELERLGLGDIIGDTWFCHTPIDGEPCGKCNPCVYTVEEGMGDRLSPKAMQRYRRRKRIDEIKKHRLLYAILRRVAPNRFEIKRLR